MIKAAIAFSTQDPPKGKRIGIITNTGGPGIQAVDEAIEKGLTLANWSDAGKARLKETQYAEASLGNPVDVVATAGPDHYFAAMDTLLKEDGMDMLLVFFVTAPFVDLDAIAAKIKEACSSSPKPVVVVIETRELWYGLIHNLREGGIPVYEFAEDGVRALAAMARYAEYRDRRVEAAPELKVDRAAVEAIIKRHEGKEAYIPQLDAFEILGAYGIPVPRVAEIKNDDDLAAAARDVGFPCVLKVDSVDVIHKSDEGGVILNIADEGQLARAFEEIRAKFTAAGTSFIAMEQKRAGQEIIIGATASPGLGSLVMFGLGGIFVEVMKDVIVSLAPLSRPEAREMMTGIKGHPVLEGIRGKEGMDLDAVEDLLLRASRLAADFPSIAEMDLNPIFAYPAGEAPSAVDVRIKIQ